MTIDLSSYTNISSHTFVRIDVPDYEIMTFSDYYKNYTIDGTNYTGLGSLMTIGQNRDEIRATSNDLAVTISGIPLSRVSDILAYKLNGCEMKMWRAFFDGDTGTLLSITDNPLQKFSGFVDNFAITDEPGAPDSPGTVALTFTCHSELDLLSRKRAGRATNSADQKRFFPSDLSMDRVATLSRSNFNFGGD